MKKPLKITLITLVSAFVLVFVVLCVAVSKKNVKIKEIKRENTELLEQVDSLKAYNRQLAEINGIQVNVSFQLKSTNVLGINTNNCQTIARDIAVYTRKELLDTLILAK